MARAIWSYGWPVRISVRMIVIIAFKLKCTGDAVDESDIRTVSSRSRVHAGIADKLLDDNTISYRLKIARLHQITHSATQTAESDRNLIEFRRPLALG